jgi:hypothetical protein
LIIAALLVIFALRAVIGAFAMLVTELLAALWLGAKGLLVLALVLLVLILLLLGACEATAEPVVHLGAALRDPMIAILGWELP